MTRVLLIDNDPAGARMMEITLRRLGGFEVVQTTDIAAILHEIRSTHVDAVVMDISLGNCQFDGRLVDGVDVAGLIHSADPDSRVPILIASAHVAQGDEARVLSTTGADAYLAKPIVEPQDLIVAVSNLLAAKRS